MIHSNHSHHENSNHNHENNLEHNQEPTHEIHESERKREEAAKQNTEALSQMRNMAEHLITHLDDTYQRTMYRLSEHQIRNSEFLVQTLITHIENSHLKRATSNVNSKHEVILDNQLNKGEKEKWDKIQTEIKNVIEGNNKIALEDSNKNAAEDGNKNIDQEIKKFGENLIEAIKNNTTEIIKIGEEVKSEKNAIIDIHNEIKKAIKDNTQGSDSPDLPIKFKKFLRGCELIGFPIAIIANLVTMISLTTIVNAINNQGNNNTTTNPTSSDNADNSNKTQSQNEFEEKFKKTLKEWNSIDEKAFWNSFADNIDRMDQLSIADQINSMLCLQFFAASNSSFIWESTSDKLQMVDKIINEYNCSSSPKYISDIYRLVANETYQDESLPRAIAANIVMLSLGQILSQNIPVRRKSNNLDAEHLNPQLINSLIKNTVFKQPSDVQPDVNDISNNKSVVLSNM